MGDIKYAQIGRSCTDELEEGKGEEEAIIDVDEANFVSFHTIGTHDAGTTEYLKVFCMCMTISIMIAAVISILRKFDDEAREGGNLH